MTTATQLRLLGENARQLPLVPEPEPLPGPCPWCGRVDVCTGGPECRYVSPFERPATNN
jgi:hypothetical protein